MPAARTRTGSATGILPGIDAGRGCAALLAIVGIRAHEHAAAAVVDDHLVEEAVGRPAQRAAPVVAVALERMILEIERDDAGMGRQRIDALLAARGEQLQRRTIVHLRIVELGRGGGVHHVAPVDLHRIRIAGGDVSMARDVLVQLDVHDAVVGERMHAARLGFARLEKAQRLGDRHLEHQAVAFSGMRWRVWMTLASPVSVVVRTPAVLAKNLRIDTALVVSSEPWSITLRMSSGPRMAAVTCTPPVPQP